MDRFISKGLFYNEVMDIVINKNVADSEIMASDFLDKHTWFIDDEFWVDDYVRGKVVMKDGDLLVIQNSAQGHIIKKADLTTHTDL